MNLLPSRCARNAALAAVLSLSCAMGFAQTDALTVQTGSGSVRGIPRPTGGAQFLGIPFAEPPVGNLRWHEPVPVKAWQGVRDASSYGAPCAQPDLGLWNRHDAETGKEDCLYLNITTPVWPAPEKPLPVMFWIHGGANNGGSGTGPYYNGGTLADHGVILVTINYRLNVFGFFAHPGLTRESAHASSGNYGLEDQILALAWVRDNIVRFGGDPHNITVFGQSAGAQDTSLMMTSSARLGFQKAIAESGAAFMAPLPSLSEAEKQGEEFAAAQHAPADPTAVIRFLRGLTPGQLIQALSDPAVHPGWRFTPDVDGYVLTKAPEDVFAAGQESPVPLMIGVTTREFGSQMSVDSVRAEVHRLAGAHAQDALKAYGLDGTATPPPDPLYGTASDQWAADVIFHCPCDTEARWHSAAHHPAFFYQYDHPAPGREAEGAVHSAELPYVFGTFVRTDRLGGAKPSEIDRHLSEVMEIYWTNFAKTGDPNSPSLPPGMPRWASMRQGAGYMEFGLHGELNYQPRPLRPAQCDVYRAVISDRMKQAK